MADPIVKNFVTDFGAVGDGVTDDSPAVVRWLAWARAQGSTPVELYMPPLNYHFADENGLTNGLINATISGYGASVDSLFIGSVNLLPQDYAHSARIQTVAAGATSVTLVNAADVSKFSVGQWILVTGLGLQAGPSFPPNFQYNEYRQITGISGSTISFGDGLRFSYESTWPEIDMNHVQNMDVAGPATIYALSPQFDSTHSYYGLTVTNSDGTFFGGRNIILDGMSFEGLGPSPSLSQSIIIRNSQIGVQNEVDKAVEHLEYDHVTGIGLAQIYVQSSSVTDLVVSNSTLGSLNGTPQNTTISNSSLDLLNVGPDFFGQGGSITVSDSTIARVTTSAHGVPPSLFTFNDGVFTVANASATEVWQWAVPGHEYFICFYDGSIHMTDDNGHVTRFKVLDVWQDATYTYVNTDLGATLPMPTFLGGQPANQYLGYPVMASAGSFAIDPSFPAISPDRTALLAQTMASFGSDNAVVNSNNVISGPDVAPLTEIAAPVDQHLAQR